MSANGVIGSAMDGLVATVPMTAVFVAAKRMGLMDEHPPERVVRGGFRRVGIFRPTLPAEKILTAAGHMAFGAAMGVCYGFLLRPERTRVPRAVQGAGFGLAVWASSYLGWLPAINVLQPIREKSRTWNISNVAAHLVYGATLGVLSGRRE